MTSQVFIEPEARADMAAAFEWYEGQLDGLGYEFLASVEATFVRLEHSPEMYQQVYREIRRAPIRRFPFALYYVIQQKVIYVLSVFHSRRDPQGWKDRISKSLARKVT